MRTQIKQIKTTPIMLVDTLKAQPRYLVVDNHLKEESRKSFIENIKLPSEWGIFVSSYEEALKEIKANLNIVLLFIGIKSENKQQLEAHFISKIKEIEDEKIKLISRVKNDSKIYIYSYKTDRIAFIQEVTHKDKKIEFVDKVLAFDDFLKIKISFIKEYFEQKLYFNKSDTLKFDYSFLDEEESAFVRERTLKIRSLFKRTTEDITNIGRYLIEVKEKIGYGNFTRWLDTEFSWSRPMAARFMRVAKRFENVNLTQLDIVHSALYVLSEPRTPEAATEEALERAKKGEKITYPLSKELRAKHKSLEAERKKQNTLEVRENQLPSRKRAPTLISASSKKPKQEILALQPSNQAVKNTWWQLGENHRLFCGEPRALKYLKSLPEKVALTIDFLAKKDFSLIPQIASRSSLLFHSEYKDLDLTSLSTTISSYIETSTRDKDLIVFNYLYYIELLELAVNLGCYCYVAEPDLSKCDQILELWRKKGSVSKIR